MPDNQLFFWLHNEHEKLLYDQRETARRALIPQQREFLAVTHQCEAAARRNLVNTLASNNEAL